MSEETTLIPNAVGGLSPVEEESGLTLDVDLPKIVYDSELFEPEFQKPDGPRFYRIEDMPTNEE